ncbi:hypothetical protein H8356DRAFT_1424662 [Neocallimastix lanati (nom. inval.)]|nr:hypothetical protein H8356DRAFT_1424662 [Neocallimastix sp. JGI-2020a]
MDQINSVKKWNEAITTESEKEVFEIDNGINIDKDKSDDNDLEDILWTEHDEDEDKDDLFSEMCEEFNEIEHEKNIQKVKNSILTAEIKPHIISLSSSNIDMFKKSSQRLISSKNNEFQEHFILLGGLSIIISYAEVQYEHNILFLASFIIPTILLVVLLGGDYYENKDLIFMIIDNSSTPKSDNLQLLCDNSLNNGAF